MRLAPFAFLGGLALSTAPMLLPSVEARDLGNLGQTFPLVEDDLFSVILARLNRMKQSGEMDRINNQLVERTKQRVLRPTPVAGIGRTSDVREWHYDPTVVLQRDLADQKGVVFAHAGQRVNPLDLMPFKEKLIFIDGDSAPDLRWALAQGAEGQTKIILVKGSPMELTKATDRKIYFDQNGFLTGKFGIENVPAIVAQDGNKLLVKEVKGSI